MPEKSAFRATHSGNLVGNMWQPPHPKSHPKSQGLIVSIETEPETSRGALKSDVAPAKMQLRSYQRFTFRRGVFGFHHLGVEC